MFSARFSIRCSRSLYCSSSPARRATGQTSNDDKILIIHESRIVCPGIYYLSFTDDACPFVPGYTIRYLVSRPTLHAGNIPREVGKWGRRSLCGHIGRGDLTISRGESFAVVDDGARRWEARVRAENFTTGPAANIVNVGYGAQSRPTSNFAAVCRTTTTRTNRAKARSLNALGLEYSQYRDTERNTLYSGEVRRGLYGFLPFLIDKISSRESITFVNFLRVVYLNYCEMILLAQFCRREIWWYLQLRSSDCCLSQYPEINISHNI